MNEIFRGNKATPKVRLMYLEVKIRKEKYGQHF